jgi:general secretion pathway protein D
MRGGPNRRRWDSRSYSLSFANSAPPVVPTSQPEGTRSCRECLANRTSRLQSRGMRVGWISTIAGPTLLSLAAFAADQPQNVLTLPCAQAAPAGSACNPSKEDLKKAAAAFSKALKLEKEKRIDEAYREFDDAARLVPRNVDYLTALAVAREELVSQHLKKGSDDLENGRQVEAQAEFRSALDLDPENSFARQRLQESIDEWAPKTSLSVQVVQSSPELHVIPNEEKHAFHFRGGSQQLLTEVARTYGITAELDESVPLRHVHFDLDNADFYTAMQAAADVTGTFWTPLAEKQILVAKESLQNRRLFERMGMRSFVLSSVTTPQEMQEVVNLLRMIFEIRFIQPQTQSGTLVVRAPVNTLDAATEFLENFGKSRPQVMLDIEVYEIDHQLTRNLGVHIPDNFNLFNIPAAALAALAGLGGQNIQSLINQLIAGGGINQANSSAISSLLAQLQNQQNSIFSQPLATFGGGLTFFGLSLDQLAAQFSLNESMVKLLDHATLRAGQGQDTTFRLGQRYPIINASFAPIFNTAAIAQVLQNGSFQAPIPSFTYEDLGLDIKAKPAISNNSTVNLQLEMQLRNLAGQSLNGVPVIANRQYKGSISLLDGEPAVVASSLTVSEQRSMTGIPGLGAIPVLNKIATTNSKTEEQDELLVVITPHVVSLESGQNAEIWLPR